MLETVLIIMTQITPYILLGLGALGAIMLLAQATGVAVWRGIRRAQT